jgi:hypothetical protein
MMQLYFLMIMTMSGLTSQQLPHRQLLIFGDESHATLIKQQFRVLNDASEEVKDRDLKVDIVNKGNTLYKKYRVKKNEFLVVLIGKDGTEKYRANKVVALNELFAIIDAMPMRRAEIRKRG